MSNYPFGGGRRFSHYEARDPARGEPFVCIEGPEYMQIETASGVHYAESFASKAFACGARVTWDREATSGERAVCQACRAEASRLRARVVR